MLRNLFSTIPFYTEDLLLALGAILLAFLLERGATLRRGYSRTKGHLVGWIFFGGYLLVLTQMTIPFSQLFRFLRIHGLRIAGSVELEPFREIQNFLLYGSEREILINLVGNVLVFIPMGLLPPLLWRCYRQLRLAWLWWLGPPVVIETLQLFTTRATTVDDVILNASGAFIGYLLYWLLNLMGAGGLCTLKQREN